MKHEVRAQLAAAAQAWFAARPWERLGQADYALVRDGATGESGWAAVMGEKGEEFGLVLYLGPDGRALLERTARGESDESEQERLADLVALAVADPAEAADFHEAMLLDARVEAAGKARIPMAFRVERGDGTRPLDDREARFLARALRGLLGALAHGLARDDLTDPSGSRRIFELTGPDAQPDVQAHFETAGAGLAADLEPDLHARPRTKRLHCGFEGGRLTVVDPKEGLVLDDAIAPPEVPRAARHLLEVLAGRLPALKPARVPRELWVEPAQLALLLETAIGRLGIKVAAKPDQKELAKARAARRKS